MIYRVVLECVNPLGFLRKYDLKDHPIFKQVLHVDKESPVKQMRQKY